MVTQGAMLGADQRIRDLTQQADQIINTYYANAAAPHTMDVDAMQDQVQAIWLEIASIANTLSSL